MASLYNLLNCYAFFLLLNFSAFPFSKVDGVDVASHHVVSVQTLVPGDVCNQSKESDPSSLEVVHRHGPCSLLHSNQNPTQNQILSHDQLRIDWLHSKSHKAKKSHGATKIPDRLGDYLSTSTYVVTVSFGTPKVKQTVAFDTGSDVTWIQCQPCVSTCYNQAEQLFNPTRSSTYRNISCGSKYCAQLDASSCSGSTCVYGVAYGDGSQTIGFFAKDTLTLTRDDAIKSFRFGCGEQNTGLFGKVAGLLGLGRENVSLVLQTRGKYGGVFSYCLPSDSSSTGYLKFGRNSVPSNVQFTPMLTKSNMPSFYFLELISISVGGKKLAVSPTLFSNAGTVIDSGTVITRLPPTAYKALRSEFRKEMSMYPRAPGQARLLDTCYDFSKNNMVAIPAVSLNFRGVDVDLDFFGIIYVLSRTQACLAFAPNTNDTDMIIVGNTQQRKFNVVYDISKKMIGFGPGGC